MSTQQFSSVHRTLLIVKIQYSNIQLENWFFGGNSVIKKDSLPYYYDLFLGSCTSFQTRTLYDVFTHFLGGKQSLYTIHVIYNFGNTKSVTSVKKNLLKIHLGIVISFFCKSLSLLCVLSMTQYIIKVVLQCNYDVVNVDILSSQEKIKV